MESIFSVDIATLIAQLSACAMVIGGVVPYIPQYRVIWQTNDAEGFSTFVCLTLLVANILRIMFWFGRHFETPLLVQSVVMIFTMMAMMHLTTRVRQRMELYHKARVFTDFDLRHFWSWTDFRSYVEAIFTLMLLVGSVTYVFLESAVYVELLGFCAVFTEAMLGMPQFYRNFSNKSTFGMSLVMVLMWTSGDIFKTAYFVLREAPIQFALCGALQVCVDLSLFLQFLYYGNEPRPDHLRSHEAIS